ncbi:Lactation elevated protein 1 [Perkinsus chesapeaki]|uniref:Lactation elevated protein 1 n=1 Tax=Perkinsus chesapeaki TaxID=330153 RepID=A0A7J6MBC6_PERCH|nr:Lactation elevated protein 1 [Perkinsus chesapeaki]
MSLQGTNGDKQNDLIDQVADEMMAEAWLLCFDEFQVTFISDAVIMRRLFSKLFQRGCVVIATSNRPPEDLYKNGLNRGLFLPFIPMINRFTEVVNLDSDVDYRYIMAQAANAGDDRSVYLAPLSDYNKRLLEAKFYRMAKNEVITHQKLEIQGRHLDVRRAAKHTALAWFTFKELCDRPLGAADYLAIGKHYHTIFLEEVPVLTINERDQVRRFITLIDGLYEAGTKLVCSAAAEPGALFSITDEDRANSAFDEVFAWDRTVSRLMEMQSGEYLSEHARKLSADEMLGQYELSNLSKEDMDDLWFRYDRDDSGSIDASELALLLEDLTEHVEGHRHVPAEVVVASMDFLDLDKNGVIDRSEFDHYCEKYGLAITGPIKGLACQRRLFGSSLDYSPIVIAKVSESHAARQKELYLEVSPSQASDDIRSLVVPIHPQDDVRSLCQKVGASIGSPQVDILTSRPASIVVSPEESVWKLTDVDEGFQLRVTPPSGAQSQPQSIEVHSGRSATCAPPGNAARLAELKEQRRRLQALEGDIRELAMKKTNKYAAGGVALFSFEWALVYYGTYFLYGWDVMEPITYLLGLFDVIVTYGFYMFWREDYSPKTFHQVIYSRQERILRHQRGFDPKVKDAVEHEIKMLEDELNE